MSFEFRLAAVGKAIDRSIESQRARIGIGCTILGCLLIAVVWRFWPSESADIQRKIVQQSRTGQAGAVRTEFAVPRPVRSEPARPKTSR